MVRQGSGEDPARLALEFAEIYHRRLGKPAEALAQYQRAVKGLSGDAQSRAALGVLECQRDLRDTSAVIEFWALQGELLNQPATVVASLDCIWSLEPSPGADALLERARLLAGLCDSLDLVTGLPAAFHQTCITALEKQTEVNPADSLALLVLDFHCRDQRQDLALAARALAFKQLGQDSLALNTWRKLRLEAPDSPWRIEADLGLAAAPSTPDAERLELLESLRRDHAYHPALETAEELRAALLYKSGDYRGALAAWNELAHAENCRQPIELLPEEGSRYDYSIGMCHEALGQETEAREAFARFLRGAGRKDRARGEDALLRIAAGMARQGDLIQAERLYRNLLAHTLEGPTMLRATRDLARLMSHKGDYAAEAALLGSLNPAASPDADLRVAWVKNLYQRADFDKAKSEFGRLLKEFRDTIDADTVKAAMNWAKGEAQLRAGNRDGAEKSFSLVVRDYRDTRYGVMARWGLARTLVGKGEAQEALGELDQLISQWPESAEAAKARLFKGRLLYESGDSRAGMRALRELAESQAPEVDRREASLLLVRIYREEGFPDGALQMLLRYLRDFPNADDHLARRMEAALLRKDLGELDPAIAEMRELLPVMDTERAAALQFYIGEALQLDGQLRAAILEYLKVPYLAGDTKLDWDVTALYQAGQCWEELGEAGRAAELYIDIIRRRGPGSSFGSAAQERINLLRAAGALSGSEHE
jgi:tetratricopeptide (TPR) repeat protein